MAETKHTPGPWKVSSDETLLKNCGQSVPVAEISAPASACWLAYVQKDVGTHAGSGEANAHLIAAAPLLYQSVLEFLALRQWVIDCGGEEKPLAQDVIVQFAKMENGVIERAQQALAAADGLPIVPTEAVAVK